LDRPQPSTWQHCEMSSKVGRRVRHAPYFFQMSRSPCAFGTRARTSRQVLSSSSSSTQGVVQLLQHTEVSIHRLLKIQKHLYTPCVGYSSLVVVHTIHSTITPIMQQHWLLTDSDDRVRCINTTRDYVVETTPVYSVRWSKKKMNAYTKHTTAQKQHIKIERYRVVSGWSLYGVQRSTEDALKI
jgi:hypothetical protein